jgi:hypothetical protein
MGMLAFVFGISTTAAATVAMLLGLAASPSRADDINFWEVVLSKDRVNGTDEYGVVAEAGKADATTCGLETPTDTFDCSNGGIVIASGLDWGGLTDEIGTEAGADWTLTWDEGLSTETIALIDFGIVLESDWSSLPTVTNPPDGTQWASPDTSIDWEWPVSPNLDRVEVALSGPYNEQRGSDELPLNTTSWTPLSPLDPGWWDAVVSNGNDIRDVPEGLSITGDTWVLENSEWLAADSIDLSTFWVVPEPSTASLLGLGLVGIAAVKRRKRLNNCVRFTG